MLGLLVLLLLTCAFVALNAFTDPSIRDRRRIQRLYGTLLEEMAAFENNGGRVQEIDDSVAQVRRMSRKLVISPAILAVLLTAGLTWLGLPIWVPAALIALYVATAGATHWFTADLFGFADGGRPRSRLGLVWALLSLVAKGGVAAVGIVVAAKAVAAVNQGTWGVGLGLCVLAVLLITYCYVPVAIVDRRLERYKEVDFANTTRTDSMLLLRSFADDNVRLYSPYGSLGPRWRFVPGRKRFEEVLASALMGRNDLVAVGRPGEKIPMLGASRTYWDENNWKDAIRSTASRTQGLLVLAGKTPSLGWEVTQLSELGLLGKTLIVFPPDQLQGTLERYRYIDEALHLEPEHQLPDNLKCTLAAMAFDDRGRPVHYVAGARDWASYIATVVHFQMVQDGEIRYEAEGSVALAVAMSEDPFYQAAYLLSHKDRHRAEIVVATALSGDRDLATAIGEAWAAVAFHQDFDRARTLLTDRVGADNDEILLNALEAIKMAEGGGDDVAILHARRPPATANPSGRIRTGKASLARQDAFRLQRLFQSIGAAEDSGAPQSAQELSRRLLQFTESLGVSTLVATAQVQLGESELTLGNLDTARSLFRQAASLRDAPRVTVSALLPRADPLDIVDDALLSLVTVAEAENDVARRNVALQELLAFRSTYGSLEDAAWAADQLGRSYGEGNDLEQASRYLAEARGLYSQAGRLENVADVARVQAHASRVQGKYEEAHGHVSEGLRAAQATDSQRISLHALKESGLLLSDPGNPGRDLRKAIEAYNGALGLAREVGDKSEVKLLERDIQSLRRSLSTTGTMFDRFNARSRRVTVLARDWARRQGHHQIHAEHVLLALLEQSDGGAARLLDRADVSREHLRYEVEPSAGAVNAEAKDYPALAPETQAVLSKSYDHARSLGHEHIGSDHLLLGLSSVDSDAKEALTHHGVSTLWLLNEISHDPIDPES